MAVVGKSLWLGGYAVGPGGTSLQLRNMAGPCWTRALASLLVALWLYRPKAAQPPLLPWKRLILKQGEERGHVASPASRRHFCSSEESPTGLDVDGDKGECDSTNKAPVRTIIRLNR